MPLVPAPWTTSARPTPEDSLKAWASRPSSPKPVPTTRRPATDTLGPAAGGAAETVTAAAARAASVDRERFIDVLLEAPRLRARAECSRT
jgi:hypothetical protein